MKSRAKLVFRREQIDRNSCARPRHAEVITNFAGTSNVSCAEVVRLESKTKCREKQNRAARNVSLGAMVLNEPPSAKSAIVDRYRLF